MFNKLSNFRISLSGALCNLLKLEPFDNSLNNIRGLF